MIKKPKEEKVLKTNTKQVKLNDLVFYVFIELNY